MTNETFTFEHIADDVLKHDLEKFSADTRYSDEWLGSWVRENTARILTALRSADALSAREAEREACAKVAEEHASCCAQARGNAGAMNDRHAVWQAEAERLASFNVAAAIRSRPSTSTDGDG